MPTHVQSSSSADRRRATSRLRLLCVMALATLGLAPVACGDGEDREFAPTGVDGPSVVGTWIGGMRPDYATSTLVTRLQLRADGSMLLQREELRLCDITGTWSVSDGRFTATGVDCVGVSNTLVAPIANRYLAGTWDWSIYHGFFEVRRQ